MERTALALLILLCAAHARAAAVEAPGSGVAASGAWSPSVQSVAAQLDAQIGHSFQQDANASLLLEHIQERLQKPDVSQAEVFSGMAMLGALTGPQEFAALEDYLKSSGTPEEVAARQTTLERLEDYFREIQDDAVTRKNFLSARLSLQRRLAKAGALDLKSLNSLFDGSLAGADAPVEAAASPKDAYVAGGYVVAPPPETGLQPSKPCPRLARAEPPPPGRELVIAQPRAVAAAAHEAEGQLEEAAPLIELTEKDRKRVEDQVAQILRLEDIGNPEDGSQRRQAQGEVRRWGQEEQRRAGELSAELEKLIAESQAEPSHTPALVKLRRQAEAMDPAQMERKQGFMRRQLSRLRGTPVEKYVADYSKQQSSVKEIVGALEKEREQLIARNDVYEAELHRTSLNQEALERAVEKILYAGSLFERKLQSGELGRDMRAFVVSKLLPELLEREESLREQLATVHNSQISMAARVSSNRKLLKIYERAITTVPRALQVAQVVRLGEEGDRRALDMSDAINKEALETLKRSYQELRSITDAASDPQGKVYVGGPVIQPPSRGGENALDELKRTTLLRE